VPHLCYLPPAPNFIGAGRVHAAVSRAFRTIVTPFPHQARLFEAAGGTVRLAAHAGLETCREEAAPLPAEAREDILALLPGSRALEVTHSLPVHLEAARQIRERHPGLTPVLCCAGEEVARIAGRLAKGIEQSANARQVLARARFALICSGTAALEAAVLGCPGVVTYHVSPLQRWEWERFHVPKLTRLRAEGIASPFVSLPNILSGEALYPEVLGGTAAEVAGAALAGLEEDLLQKRARLDRVAASLSWEPSGEVIASLVQEILSGS
jgi:lipid-A-disaccharide synthase